jgi:hypothetical protein
MVAGQPLDSTQKHARKPQSEPCISLGTLAEDTRAFASDLFAFTDRAMAVRTLKVGRTPRTRCRQRLFDLVVGA